MADRIYDTLPEGFEVDDENSSAPEVYDTLPDGFEVDSAPADRFETKLDAAEEAEFQKWKKINAPKDSGADYDLRGAFKAGLNPDKKTGHWPDTYKKPNHPTFSVESKYAKDAPEKAGHWDGETYIPASGPGTHKGNFGDNPKPPPRPDVSIPAWKNDRDEMKLVDGTWFMRSKRSGAILNMNEADPDYLRPTDDTKILGAFGKSAPTKEAQKQIRKREIEDRLDAQAADPGAFADLEAGWYGLQKSLGGIKFVGSVEALKEARAGKKVGGMLDIPPELLEKAAAEGLTEIAQAHAAEQGVGTSPSVERFNNSKTWGEVWDALAADPYVVTRSTVLRSAPQSMPSVIGGIAGSVLGPLGAATGAGLGSYGTELGSAIGDGLQEHGADLNDPASVRATWAKFGPQILKKANVRAAIIGVVDAATGGVTSKLVQKPAETLLGTFGKQLTGTGIQATGGAGGEAAARVATGDPLDPGALAGEALGEVGSGMAEVAGQSVVGAVKQAVKGDRLDVSGDDGTGPAPLDTLPEGFVVDEEPAQTVVRKGAPSPGKAPMAPRRKLLENQTVDESVNLSTEPPAKVADSSKSEPHSNLPEGFTIDGGRDAPAEIKSEADIETARLQVAEPTEAQAAAGNYRKGHVTLQGLNVTIETPKRGERSGKGPDGKPWSVTMQDDYGYVKRSEGADGEQVDVFIGPDPQSEKIFVIDQVDPDTKVFDEHKSVMGAKSEKEARAIYERAFSDGKGAARIGGIKTMAVPEFKAWLKEPQTKPAAAAPEPVSGSGKLIKGPKPDISPALPPVTSDHEKAVEAYIGGAGNRLTPEAMATAAKMDVPEASRLLSHALGKGWVKQTRSGKLMRPPRSDKPVTLMQFLAENGGLVDQGGELRARDLHTKMIPGQGRLVRKNGMTLDEARELAVEAGYIDDAGRRGGGESQSTIQNLLDALDRENSGQKVVKSEDQAKVKEAEEAAAVKKGEDELEGRYSEGERAFIDLHGFEAFEAIDLALHRHGMAWADWSVADLDRAAGLIKEGMDAENALERAAIQAEQAEDVELANQDDPGIIPFDEAHQRTAPESRDGVQPSRDEGEGAGAEDAPGRERAPPPEPGEAGRATGEPGQETPVKSEKTDAGEQTIVPGTERISEREQAQRKADEKLKPKAEQKPMESGLFGDERNQADIFDKPIPARSRAAPAPRIEDFGEKIEGARKDAVRQAAEALAEDIDIAAEPLSRIFPQPDYVKLAEAGVSPEALAYVALFRDEIPAKPRRHGKLKRWADQVRVLRDFSQKLLAGTVDPAAIEREIRARMPILLKLVYSQQMISGIAPQYLEFAAKWRMTVARVSMFKGKAVNPPEDRFIVDDHNQRWTDIEGDTIEAIRENAQSAIIAAAGKATGKTGERRTPISIYADRFTKEAFIGFKGMSGVIRLKTGFASVKDARAYAAEHAADLQAQIDQMREGPDLRRAANMPRIGPPRREGDVTPAKFQEAFGFRGVQFGNYVEDDRRQSDLNEAFDALMDLADILKVPSQALSLNGQLGLAFGARGHGGKRAAAAHYESDKVVINLTKHAGPGSLAHEWLHALDNYFAKLDQGVANPVRTYISDAKRPGGKARGAIYEAWKAIEKTITRGPYQKRALELDEARSKPYWSTTIELAARAFERYVVDRLADQQNANDFLANLNLESGAYPNKDEMESQGIRAAFDNLFNTIEANPSSEGRVVLSSVSPGPVTTITGGELGVDFRGPEDMPALRRAAERWYEENLRDTVAHLPDGTPVRFSRKSQKESTWKKTDLILRAVPAIRDIIEKGTEVHRAPGDRQGVKESVWIAAPVDVMGKVHNLVVILHVREDGTWHYYFGYGTDTGSPGVKNPGGPAQASVSRQPEIEIAPGGDINLFELGPEFKVAPEPGTDGYDRLPPYSFAISKKQWLDIANRVHALAGTILGHRFEVNIVDEIDDAGTQGIYVPDEQAIYVAVRASYDALETMGHEAIHALRDIGAISEREWKTLSDWARENHLPTTNIRELYEDRYRRRFDVTPEQLEDLLVEEAVADAFGKFVTGDLKTPRSASARGIFDKLRRFLEAVRRYLSGKGFKSADDILASIARGDMANRAGRGSRGFELYLREGSLDSVSRLENVQRPEPMTGDPYDVTSDPATKQELADIASNINLDYIAAPADIKQVISDVSSQSAHFIGARRGVISNQQTRELAADLGMSVEDLKKRQHGQAFNAESIFAARVLLVKSATRLRELAAKARKTEKLADLAEFQKAFTRHVAIQEQVAGLAAEAGRALQQFKMMAGDNFYKGAKDLIETARSKNPDDPFGSRNKFGKDAVLDLADMVDALDDPAAINRFSRDTFRVTIGSMIREAWINALLSGFRTHATNILSNSLTALWQVPETAVAAAFGAMHGGEKVQFAEASARLVGLIEGAQEGLRAGATAFKTGEPSDLGSKIESHRIKAIPGLAGEIIRIPSRALLAEDEVFKAVNYRAEINAQATRIAMREGRRGQSLAARIAELRANPTQAMKTEAHKAALYNTYQNDLGPIGKTVMQFRDRVPGAWIILPFIKTPANIIKYAAERSPFGLLMQEVRDNVRGKNGNVARDTQLARLTLGTSIGVAVAMMTAAGMISGGGPDDPDERNLLRAKGWQPYSVKIGDSWYSYQRLDPFGFMIGVSADLVELGEAVSDAEASKVGSMIVSSISGNLLEKTWLRGLGDLIQAVQDPERYGEYYIRGLVGTLIPTGVAQFAQTQDPVLRDARTIVDVLKSRIPGMSSSLMPRRNIFGDEIRREGALGPDLISPIFSSTEKDDKAIDAMLELHYSPSMPRREINGHKLNEVLYDEYSELAGKAAKKELDRKVNQASWDRKNPDDKIKIIRDVFNEARDDARTKMKRKHPELKKKAKL